MRKISFDDDIVLKYNSKCAKSILYHTNERAIYDIPYISIGYWNPKPYDTDDVIIPVYITDFFQREYLNDDYSLRFRLRVELDGNVTFIDDLQAGEHDINLGKLSEGMHYFTLQVFDEDNECSGRISNDIWVINEDNHRIKDTEIYYVTLDDLTKHNITLNSTGDSSDEELRNNRLGVTSLLQTIKSQGFRKCVMINGVYRFTRSEINGTIENGLQPILIPSDFTLDLNGSTFKLQPYDDRDYTGIPRSMMIDMNNCHDSHLINGTIEGDYAERLLMDKDGENAITGDNGEFNNALTIRGGQYNSLENLTITQYTGYNICGGFSDSYGEWPSIGTAIDKIRIIDGVETPQDGYCSTSYADISNVDHHGYVACGLWLGYGGIVGKHWDIDYSFYDQNKNFIECIRAYQQRRVRIPVNAKYVRLTFKTSAEVINESGICYHHMNSMRYCEINNCTWIDNRTCVAIAQHQHLHMYKCNFIRSGKSITPGPIDFEDGWEQQQDTYLRYSNIVEQSGTFDLIDCAGINTVVEYCDNWRITVRSSRVGITIRNNTRCAFELVAGYKTLNTVRVYDNELVDSDVDYTEAKYYLNDVTKFMFKNNDIKFDYIDTFRKSEFKDSKVQLSGFYKRCTFVDCEVQITSTTSYNCEDTVFIGCDFTLHPDFATNKFSMNVLDAFRLYRDCNFHGPSEFVNHQYFNSGIFKNCTFNGTVLVKPGYPNTIGDLVFVNCVFNDIITIDTKQTYIKFEGCTFNSEIIYNRTESENYCIFE